MRTALALVLALGALGGGIAVSSPPKQGKHKIAPQPVAKLSPQAATSEAMPTFPAAGIASPQGWIIRVQNATGRYAGMNGYQTAVARVLTLRYVQTPTGIQTVPGDIEPPAMHGSSPVGNNNMFQSTLRPDVYLRVTTGNCYISLKGAGIAFGQATGGGSFTGHRHASDGSEFDVVVTAVP
jgi:hypothetical protein